MNVAEQARNVWTLTLTGERPMTMNWGRGKASHWSQHAAKTADTRRAYWALARQAAIPSVPHVEFEVWPLHKDLRSPQDTGACAPAAKAAIDGIICAMDGLPWDAKQFNDGPDRVLGEMMRPPACGVGKDGMTIVVRSMSEAELPNVTVDRTLMVPVPVDVCRLLAVRVGRVDYTAWGVEAGRLLSMAVTDAVRQ